MPEGALLPDKCPAGGASNIGVLVLKEPTGDRRSAHPSPLCLLRWVNYALLHRTVDTVLHCFRKKKLHCPHASIPQAKKNHPAGWLRERARSMSPDLFVCRGVPTDPQTQIGWCGSPLQVLRQRFRDAGGHDDCLRLHNLLPEPKDMGETLNPGLLPAQSVRQQPGSQGAKTASGDCTEAVQGRAPGAGVGARLAARPVDGNKRVVPPMRASSMMALSGS